MESNPKRVKTNHAGGFNADLKIIARLTTASTFVLETDELLKNFKVDYGKTFAGADSLLFKLRGAVEGLETIEPEKIGAATKNFEKKHKIIIPYPDPRPADDSPYLLSFSKSSKINVVGSYVVRSMARGQSAPGIDMVVEMPKDMFQDKDYMNMRYFYRRAFFVAHLAQAAQSVLGNEAIVEFEYMHQNELLPVVILKLIKKESEEDSDEGSEGETEKAAPKKTFEDYVIRIMPCAPPGLFSKPKLAPWHCCNKQGVPENKRDTTLAATPFYNNTIKAEETFITYLRILTAAKKDCAAFSDACLLGRVWLKQRGFSSSVTNGGFGSFEWSLMLALLLKASDSGKKVWKCGLSSALSATELFKAAIQFLSAADFVESAFVFGGASKVTAIEETKEIDRPVLYDPERNLNIAYKMTSWSAGLLRLYAKATHEILGNPALAQFDNTFIVKANVPSQIYDAVFHVTLASSAPLVNKLKTITDRKGLPLAISSELYRVLSKAYGDRVQLVHINWSPRRSWAVNGRAAKISEQTFSIGIVFNAANAARIMDLGPLAEEEEEALEFRTFWGPKSELRRFKDGSIRECLTWENRIPIRIIEEIAAHILGRHFKIEPESIELQESGIPDILNIQPIDKESFDMAKRAFGIFEKDIRALNGMPLHVRRMSPIGPSSRYASTSVPELRGHFTCPIKPMEVLLYFEASGKWPENLVAIQEAKIEFLLDIHKRLTSAHDNITAYIGRDNVEQGIFNLAYLDVVYSTGAAFRLRIYSEMEGSLLERQVVNKILDASVRAAAEVALAEVKYTYETLPLHTQTIDTACTRLPALSGTIRLVKYWFTCQKLSDFFSEELIELFTLRAFLEPAPWSLPSSPVTGFLRTLFMLARWDWRDEPLIVDNEIGSSGAISFVERTALREKLTAWRSRDPGMKNLVLFVATPSETSGHAYTRNGPSIIVAARMTRLAKSACKAARGSKQGSATLDYLAPENVAVIFKAPLRDYDVLLHISNRTVSTILRAVGGAATVAPMIPSVAAVEFKNLGVSAPWSSIPLPLPRFPVAVLVEELRRVYGDYMEFFYGGEQDTVIGAIWTTKAKDVTQTYRVGLTHNFIVPGGEGAQTVELNKKAVLLEIARIGGELIRKIDVIDS